MGKIAENCDHDIDYDVKHITRVFGLFITVLVSAMYQEKSGNLGMVNGDWRRKPR
jgi:hypothetical protein